MATYELHTYLDDHEGQKTGQVRSCTPGARIEAPAGEFSDLVPGRDYSRLDEEDAPAEEEAPDEE
jgi:hypothetical protein